MVLCDWYFNCMTETCATFENNVELGSYLVFIFPCVYILEQKHVNRLR